MEGNFKGETMWKSEYMIGINFIDDQHQHLHELATLIRETSAQGDRRVTFDLMDDFFYYLMFHFENENKLMQSIEYPMYYDHHMSHSSMLSNVLASIELAVKDFDKGIESLIRTFDTLYERHLKEFDLELSVFERQSLPQKVEDYYHLANGQLIFFENGYIISAFGEVDEKIISEFVTELGPLIEAHYAHKTDWIVITDFRRWKYITKDAVDIIKNFVASSDHNRNITRFYLIEEDGLSRYLVDQMLGVEMKDDIVVHEMYDVLKALNDKNHRMGKTLKTCNFGNLRNVDMKAYFGRGESS